MKNTLNLVIISLLVSLTAIAQDDARGITAAEFAAAKTLTIKNIEKDTYLRANGMVFDRDDSRPPYVFKFSDGIERRIYVYKIFEAEGMKPIGSLAVYHTPKDGKMLTACIPTNAADKALWGRYIDDLKDNAKLSDGYAVCMAFMLSKENAGQSTTAKTTADADHNEFCFPADAYVRLSNGTETTIDQIKAGDELAGSVANRVERVTTHDGTFALTQIVAEPLSPLLASAMGTLRPESALVELEATANHPILTATGRKAMGELQPGDLVFVATGAGTLPQLAEVKQVRANSRVVNRVYNLTTATGWQEINGVVALDK